MTARELGWHITLYPLLFPDDVAIDIGHFFSEDVCIELGKGLAELAALVDAFENFQAVMVCRPHNMAHVLRTLGGRPRPANTRLIYDSEAFFARREDIRARVFGGASIRSQHRAAEIREAQLGRSADAIITTSMQEAEPFREHSTAPVFIVRHAIEPQPSKQLHGDRNELLFVGSMQANDGPNADAIVWFVQRVLPRFSNLLGHSPVLRIVGRNRAERVRKLANEKILVVGQLDDLSPAFSRARLFVAPTRFAAGIPIKVLTAAAAGVPVVATSLLADQLGWKNGREIVTADGEEAFAAACARLWNGQSLWSTVREGAITAIKTDFNRSTFRAHLAAALGE